jgi:predicted nucleotidyltransferase
MSRKEIAQEAAKIMYREGVKEYFNAKRIAAKRILGKTEAKATVRFRPHDMPSNGEIKEELVKLASLAEGDDREARIFAMRVTALDCMKKLERFEPRLIGSVASGKIRQGSDIDLHVFTNDFDVLEAELKRLGWVYEHEDVLIQKNGTYREFTHYYVDVGFPLELSVYGLEERRITTRSSVSGKPIERVGVARLEEMLREEHPDRWAAYLQDGVLPSVSHEMPGEFDGLLAKFLSE